MARLVFVAEDDPYLRSLYEMVFDQPPSWSVRTFGTGEELLGALAAELPALIVLDVLMPGIGGMETCRRLRALPELRELPVLFVTAIAETADRAGPQGPQVWLRKPVSLQALLSAARQLTGDGAP